MEEQIKAWKEQYKFIYKIRLGEKDYYFRPLSRKDYLEILSTQSNDPEFDNDLEVAKRCTLTPFEEGELENKAGLATVLSEKIMTSSGFDMAEAEAL